MADRHKTTPLRFRPPEPERSWLATYQERTGKPMNAILTEAVRLLMAEETKTGKAPNPLREQVHSCWRLGQGVNVMSARPEIGIFLIQHIDNPRRYEARNVGVVVSDSRHVAYRLIDPAQEHQSQRYRQAVGSVAADETYPAWLAYWMHTLERGTEGLSEIVARQKATFPVIEAGRMMGDVPDDLHALAARYFDELVLPPPESSPARQGRGGHTSTCPVHGPGGKDLPVYSSEPGPWPGTSGPGSPV